MAESEFRARERTAERTAVKTETKTKEASGVCPHCGAPIEEHFEICPVCGWKLVDYCTFCGAPMRPDDIDCPECGMPSDGVVCPNCNTLNFRPFCRKCNQPLSKAARRAVEKARQDPKVHEAARLMSKLAELEAELETAAPEEAAAEEPQGPTEGELRLRELMAKVGFTPAEKPKVTQRKIGRSREDILAEYQKAVRPGVPLKEIGNIPWDFIMRELEARLVKGCKGKFKLLYDKRPHGVSHFIGEQIHEGEPGTRSLETVLRPGMLISCEPGLYGEFEATIDGKKYREKIGIRIEDDLLITKDGFRNISQNIPKTVADLEKLMA